MLLVYPKPMETEAKREIEEHNFSLKEIIREDLSTTKKKLSKGMY